MSITLACTIPYSYFILEKDKTDYNDSCTYRSTDLPCHIASFILLNSFESIKQVQNNRYVKSDLIMANVCFVEHIN